MSYTVLNSFNSKYFTIEEVVNNADVVSKGGPEGATAYWKAYAEGPTAYAEFGEAYWDGYTNKVPVYGGGCTIREWACVILAPGYKYERYTGIRTEEQPCPSGSPTKTGVILRYQIINSGSGFNVQDIMVDDSSPGKYATFELLTVGSNGEVTSVKMIEGGEGYTVGEELTLRGSDFPNLTDCVIKVLAVENQD